MILGATCPPASTFHPEYVNLKKMRGTVGNDDLIGKARADQIFGLAGDDVIHGNGGADILKGGTGFDYIYGGSGGDRIFGEGDGDYLYGDGGNDFISGGDGNDVIVGGRGKDRLMGDNGNDLLFSIAGDDIMLGGWGDDTYHIAPGYVTARDVAGNDEYVVSPDSHATITDKGGTDKLRIADGSSKTTLLAEDMWFQRFGNDLVISVDGYSGITTISRFFSGDNTHRIERIYDEERKTSGLSLLVEGILDMENGAAALSGAFLWDL